MQLKPLVILGLPRSGTSLVARLCISAGYDPQIFSDSKFFGGSPYNEDGYYEEVRLTLLNDQLIRGLYSEKHSFLYPPNPRKTLKASDLRDTFFHDIDHESLSIPVDFEDRLIFYTGTDSDYWGLTRMQNNGKWLNGYRKFGVSNGAEIKKAFTRYNNKLASDRRLVLKDPRLCITGHLYDLSNCDLLFVERDTKSIVDSMKRHYGPRLFSAKCFVGFDWVSNHFNLKVPPMEEETFIKRYIRHLDMIKSKHISSFVVRYEALVGERPRPHTTL